MPVRVLVNGSSGKMGQVALKAIENDPDLELAGEGHRNDHLSSLIENIHPDVVLDFTTASVIFENTSAIIEAGVCPVIGTSGLLQDQVEELQARCEKKGLGGVIVPNFSISAVLMMKYAQDAARYFSRVEIVELHHDEKRDAPSGTAIRTAEMIAENSSLSQSICEEAETISGARGAKYRGVSIHSVRLPGLVAHQEVLFGGQGQVLRIRSDLIHREAFSPGICVACKKVMKLTELKYGLEHLL